MRNCRPINSANAGDVVSRVRVPMTPAAASATTTNCATYAHTKTRCGRRRNPPNMIASSAFVERRGISCDAQEFQTNCYSWSDPFKIAAGELCERTCKHGWSYAFH
mmetsp:Transcript_21420/g.34261  ORF Transcript_21420/g.34261 Transcript_21420/m.34261 type:complete len:106 (+) Transcript_21420:68-385(+)